MNLTISEIIGPSQVVYTNEELTRRNMEMEKILDAVLLYLNRKDSAELRTIATPMGINYELANFG